MDARSFHALQSGTGVKIDVARGRVLTITLCSRSYFGHLICALAAIDWHNSMGAPNLSATERRLYGQFFEHLGVGDSPQLGKLSSLLHIMYDAVSKLDDHLAPFGATIHCAASRLIVSENPRETPCYRWIRVVDRLGFFSDDDDHAQRVVNIGLSFAYRHLEVNALADANAVLLPRSKTESAAALAPPESVDHDDTRQRPADSPALEAPDGPGALPLGGVVISATTDRPLPSSAQVIPAPESALPNGGRSVAKTTGGEGPAEPPASKIVLSADKDVSDVHGDAKLLGDLPPGGVVVSRRGAMRTVGETDTAGTADADEAEDGDEAAAEQVLPQNVFERQPTVNPPASAVAAVSAVVKALGGTKDAADVLRKLLTDSVLCLARTAPGFRSAGDVPFCPTGSTADRAAVTRLTSS